MNEQEVPIMMDLGGDRFEAGTARIVTRPDGEIEITGTVTDAHVSELLCGTPSRNPLFLIPPFSIYSKEKK